MERETGSLLDRIMAFAIDERPKTLSFEARLARENGWSLGFARRVVVEYKRFIYLCMEAGHPCTPSDQVDQAWHLHLTYTKSYWERLNGQILPRSLHHNPTEGGDREDVKFDDWYARTQESYERLFGQLPPADIWPPAEVRFGDDSAFVRVNAKRYWFIPKRPTIGLGAGLAIVLLVAGCTAQEATVGFFVFVALTSIVALMIWALVASSGGRPGGCGGGGGCGSSDSGGSGCASAGCGSGCGGGGCGGGCSG